MLKKIMISFVLVLTLFGCSSSNGASHNDTSEVTSVDLSGSYQDQTSQRATMEISKDGDSFQILVHWSNSAEEYVEWEMDATLQDEKLNYSDGTKKIIHNDQSTTEYDSKEGYFEYKDDLLYWTGAFDEDCKDCVFEKME